MTTLSPILASALAVAGEYRYLLLFVGTIVEGPVLMVACGFLLRLGVFEPVPMFVALASGDLVADVGWYYLGYWFLEPFARRYGHFFSVTPNTIERVKKLFHHYHDRILMISKLTIGFGMAIGVLMVAGASRVPFRRYLAINIAGEIIFVVIMLTLGYAFGHAYEYVTGVLRWFFIAGAAIITIGLVAGISRYARHKMVGI